MKMPKTRRAALITSDGKVVCKKQPIPELKENEVMVKIHATLISPGTELYVIRTRGENPLPNAPSINFGYSSAGEIVAMKGDCKGLQIGMRVACMGGGACHADHNCIPVNLVVPIPDNVSYEEATFTSLAATALQAVRRTEPQLGEYGMVLGQGIVGNIAAQLCQLSGARVLTWESMRFRTTLAKKCGLAHSVNFLKNDATAASKEFAAPYGMDFAIMAFGGDADKAFLSVKDAMKISADGHQMGRITVVGGCHFRFDGGAWSGNIDVRCSSRTGAGYHDSSWEYGKDYPDVFVQFTSQRNARELITLIAEKRLKVAPLITHHFRIEDVADAVSLLMEHADKSLGVILTM